MSNVIKIFLTDARRISQNVVAVVIIMGLSILPSLYAWFNIFSNWDPYGPDATSNLKVAVVSEDAGISIAGNEVNIGSGVIDGLKSNHTIGWVFVETSGEAVDGVYDGTYYAALIIPEKFTEEMISFLGGEVEHPDIIYYENAKKNAIAPKITQKARTAVQEQVNSTFVSTLAESLMKVSNVLAGTGEDGVDLTDGVLSKLNSLSGELQSYINILNSFVGILNSAQSIIETSQVMMPSLNQMVSTGEASINSMQSMLIGASGTSDTVADMVSYSLEMVNDSLSGVASVVAERMGNIGNYGTNATDAVGTAQTLMPYLEQMFDNAVLGWEDSADESTKTQIQAVRTQLALIRTDVDVLAANASATREEVTALANKISTEITACQNAITALKDTFTYSVKPQLNATMNEMQNAMVSTASILDGVDADFGGVQNALGKYQATLEQGNTNLTQSLAMAQELLAGLNRIMTDIVALQQDEQYQQVIEIIKSDPKLLGEFVASPVNLDTVGIYEIENYGSAMAPFYTILALWVGALILVAIIHVKVEPIEGLENVKPYQEFFGRYILFFLIGQVQTLITVFGDLFYIRIQCHNPFLFWLAAAVSSLVFTLFIYSLTVAFGNVGEALAIIVMVIQVAGAGGTFPIETLPEVYQFLYKYLPFPYGMNAMRETIGGIYQMDYWKCIGALGIYLGISLFIGLLLAKPFRKLNHIIERSKEKSGVMI